MSTSRMVGRVFAALVALFLVAVLPITLLAYDAQAIATSRGFLTFVVSDSRLLEAGLAEAAQDLAREVPQASDTRGLPIARLKSDDWELIIRTVVPPSSVQRWTAAAFDKLSLWGVLRGDFLDDVILPLGEIHNNLVNDPKQTALRIVTEAQPACTAGQEPFASSLDLIPRCRPAASELASFYQTVSVRWKEQPQQVWQQLWPGESGAYRYVEDISLGEFIRRESGDSWQEIRTDWRYAAWVVGLARGLLALLLIGGPVLALALVALLAARSLPEALRWVGAPLLLTGVLAVGLGLVVWFGGWMGPLFASPVGIGPEVQGALETLARLFTRKVLSAMAWQGGLMVVLGLAMWGSSFLIRKRRAAA